MYCPCSGKDCQHSESADICTKHCVRSWKRGYERCAWINDKGREVKPGERKEVEIKKRGKS